MMPQLIVAGAESEDDYLFTFRRMKISICGIEFWMESLPLLKIQQPVG
jgi:hypothetical protein